jgi:mRNA interferase RelE/StbE
MATVEYTEQALAHLDDLQPDVADRFLRKLDEAAEWPTHRLDSLTGYPYHSVRIGDYRAIVSWDQRCETITVEAVGHRKNVYDRHLPP